MKTKYRHFHTFLEEANTEELANLFKALSSKPKLDIIILLRESEYGIQEIANILGIQVSSAAFHIKTLEQSNIIEIIDTPGIRGRKKVCRLITNKIDIDLACDENIGKLTTFKYNIPIGSYIDFYAEANPTCGLASEKEIIEIADDPSSFYSVKKTEAQIIWFSNGFLSYKFPNYFIREHKVSEISYQLEICSEAPFYNMNFKSDITVWINDVELLTYTSPSDFGNRRGKLTPEWWSNNLSQYGELKRFTVTKNGVFIDNVLVNNNITLDDLSISNKPFISFKIGNKKDAIYRGGLNLFGSKFGDYNQDITMQIIVE
jgi:predicted transcriptional regulator